MPEDFGDRRDEAVGEVLFRLVALSRRLSSSRRHPFGDVRLTGAQLDALLLLAHCDDAATAGALSAALGLTPGAVTQLVDTLVAAELVERSTDPADARVRRVQLTDSARQRVSEFEDVTTLEVMPWFAALDGDQVRDLARLLGGVQPPSGLH